MKLLELIRVLKPMSKRVKSNKMSSTYDIMINDNEETLILIDKQKLNLEIFAFSKNRLLFTKLIKIGYKILYESDDFYFDICTQTGAEIKKPMFISKLSCV